MSVRAPTSSVSRKSKATPFRVGDSAKPRRRGRSKFVTTSQSASQTAPLEGEPFPLRRDNPSGAPRQLPLTRGAFGAYKSIKLPRKKVQTGKSGLHLLLMANILRKLVANLIPPVSGGAYRDARKVSLVWNDI